MLHTLKILLTAQSFTGGTPAEMVWELSATYFINFGLFLMKLHFLRFQMGSPVYAAQ